MTSSWGGTRYLPYAFTEQGIYMLMTVLKGDLATRQSKSLIRLFKKMKDYIVNESGQLGQQEILSLAMQTQKNTDSIQSIQEQMRQRLDEACNGQRAEYGKGLVKALSERLTAEFGKGFSVQGLWNMRQFYQCFPILSALRRELSWTHYRMLMRVNDPKAREYYVNECAAAGWSSRELERKRN